MTRAIASRAKAAVPALAAVLLTVGLSLPAVADEIFVVERGELKKIDSVTGQRTVIGPTNLRPLGATFLDRDRLLLLTEDGSLHVMNPEDATSELFLPAPADEAAFNEASLAVAPGGYVYLSKRQFPDRSRLELLDLETLEIESLGALSLTEPAGGVPDSLGGVGFIEGALVSMGLGIDFSQPGLFTISPATGAVDRAVAYEGPNPLRTFEEDSLGQVWVLQGPGIIAPPANFLSLFDPQTGFSVPNTPAFVLSFDTVTFAIRPQPDLGCVETATRKCFLGGRYTAEVRFRDFAGLEGDGRVVPGASDNTSLFWFFAADNWELMVKVLDGCENNGNSWVFLSATTNVELTVTVTDQVTGESRTYENPLGQEAMTVLDTEAFGCAP
ncbi:MAG: hypothetical protein AAF725_06410 [Acidobacteriota bacterium]